MAETEKIPSKSPRKRPPKTPGYVPVAEMRAAAKATASKEPEPQPTLWFEDFKTDDRVRIQREDDQIKKWINHGYLSPEECTDEKVFGLWGGGKYWGTLLRMNDRGVEQGADSTRRLLPGEYKGNNGMVGVRGAPSPAANGNTGIMGRIPDGVDVKTFLDNVILARSLDALERKDPPLPVAVAPSHSIMDQLLVALVPAAPKLLEAWINRKPVADPIMELIKEMRADMVAVKSAPTPAAAAMNDQVKAIKEIVALSELLRGGGGDGDGGEKNQMWAMGTKLLEALAGQRGPMAQPPMMAPGQPILEAGEASPLPLWHQWLLHYAGQLEAAARRGMDPQYLAEMVVNLLPTDEEGILVEFLAKVNAEQLAMDTVPVLREFPTWTAALVAALRKEMVSETTEEGAPDDDVD